MSSAKKKGLVSKDDLKRLMKQSALQNTTQKIDSPLAKYDSLGNLYCALCSMKVKSHLHWKAHVQGRTHKDNLEDLKHQAVRKQEATVAPPSELKRKHSGSPTSIAEKGVSESKKSRLPSDFFDKSATNQTTKSSALGLGGYSSFEDDDDGEQGERKESTQSGDVTKMAAKVSSAEGTTATGLPADYFDSGVTRNECDVSGSRGGQGQDDGRKAAGDFISVENHFFDSGVTPSESVRSAEVEEVKVRTMAERLPEGFFDDPKADAKAREIKYVDKDEEEWELFQKAIKEENVVSEQIQEVEEDEKQTDRNVHEIDEHIYRWSRIEQLHNRKGRVMSSTVTSSATNVTSSATNVISSATAKVTSSATNVTSSATNVTSSATNMTSANAAVPLITQSTSNTLTTVAASSNKDLNNEPNNEPNINPNIVGLGEETDSDLDEEDLAAELLDWRNKTV